MRWWLIAFLTLLTLLRFLFIAQHELSPDESYYYMWSQRPALAYYSKGPGVALTIRAGTSIFGPTEFGVRFFSPLLALATCAMVFLFTRQLFGEAVATWTVIVLNMIPIFQVGGVIMTIDPLSIFFWAAALFAFWNALQKSPEFTWLWPATGLLIGLGFLSKYTNAMQLLGVVLVLAIVPGYRKEFARPGFYSLLLPFALCTIPPIVWNAEHEWITLAHLSARGGLQSAFKLSPSDFFQFLGAHFGVYSPGIFAAMLFSIWFGFRKLDARSIFLLCFALPLLAMYFILAWKKSGEANWTAPACLTLGILATATIYELASRKVWARFATCSLALGLAISVSVLNTDLLRHCGVSLSYNLDPGARLRGWRTTAQLVQEYRAIFEKQNGHPVFLIANKYQTAASLSFYLAEKRVEAAGGPPVYIPESQNIENQFSFWPRYEDFLPAPKGSAAVDEYYTEEQGANPFIGRDALYITDRAEERPPTTIKEGFEKAELVALFTVRRNHLPLREIRIFACHKYRSLPL